jgi:hypothetical protein
MVSATFPNAVSRPSEDGRRQGLAPEVSDLKDEHLRKPVNQPSRDRSMQHMLRIQMIGLALVAMLVISVVAAASASAEAPLPHEWLIGGKLIASPVKIHSLGLLLLEDSKIPAIEGGPVRVHCHGFDTGTIGPHALDLIESITLELLGKKDLILCLFDKEGGCKSGTMPVALALHLPWHTELVLQGTEVRDLILADGNGEPGWNITCTNILGGVTEDECLAEAGKPGSTSLKNVAAGVLGEFEAKSPNAKCTKGGEGAGVVRGTVLFESPSGEAKDKLTFF